MSWRRRSNASLVVPREAPSGDLLCAFQLGHRAPTDQGGLRFLALLCIQPSDNRGRSTYPDYNQDSRPVPRSVTLRDQKV